MDTLKMKLSDITKETSFSLSPEAETRQNIARILDIIGIRKLTFAGTVSPTGKSDWVLSVKLGATVQQACVVSLDPVTTRIDEEIKRRYVSELPELAEGSETEMPSDDTIEEAPVEIDLQKVMIEALSLALPPWPRRDDLDPFQQAYAEPGISPMTDEDAKPFAELKNLKSKLAKSSDPGDSEME